MFRQPTIPGLLDVAFRPADAKPKRDKGLRRYRSILRAVRAPICELCERPLPESDDDLHIHHRKPFSKGGSNDLDNLTLTHAFCNVVVGARTNVPPSDVRQRIDRENIKLKQLQYVLDGLQRDVLEYVASKVRSRGDSFMARDIREHLLGAMRSNGAPYELDWYGKPISKRGMRVGMGHLINQTLRDAGLTRVQLSRRGKVHQAWMLGGRRPRPSIEELVQIMLDAVDAGRSLVPKQGRHKGAHVVPSRVLRAELEARGLRRCLRGRYGASTMLKRHAGCEAVGTQQGEGLVWCLSMPTQEGVSSA